MANVNEILANGEILEAATGGSNAIETLTIPAVAGMRNFLGGIEADYSAPVAAIKTVTLTYTKRGVSTVIVWRHDFTNGEFNKPFPLAIHGDENTAITIDLAADSGGATGRVLAFRALI